MNLATLRRYPFSSAFKRAALAGILAALAGGLNAADPATATPVRKIDDFNQGTPVNLLGGENKAWIGEGQDPSVHLNSTWDGDDRAGSPGHSLRLDYDVESVKEHLNYPSQAKAIAGTQQFRVQGTGFGGFTVPLMDLDARPYRYLCFWMKGDGREGYTRRIRVELYDGTTVGRYWVENITDSWREFTVPLGRFEEVGSWTALKTMTLVFDEGMTNKRGVIYLDDVEFRTASAQEIPSAPPVASALRSVEGESPFPGNGLKGESREAASILYEPGPDRKTLFGMKKPYPKARFLWRWDPTYLYLSVEVEDDSMDNGFNGGELDKGDSVEIFLSPTGSELEWDDPAAFRIGLAPTGLYREPQTWAWFQKRRPSSEEVSVAVVPSQEDKSYGLAARIRWSFLGLQPSEGMSLGLGIQINDPEAGPKAALSSWGVTVDDNKRKLGKLVIQ